MTHGGFANVVSGIGDRDAFMALKAAKAGRKLLTPLAN
jgi:hypothetical protein